MPVNLSGSYLEAGIEGTSAEVTVETVHGNVRVVGGSGAVSVRSVMGVINVDKASGRVNATTVNEGIRLTNVTGEITAETTNGDIVIENAQGAALEASTVNGDITFNGAVRDGGAYRLTTHSGDIRAGLGGAANATVFVRTFQGDFSVRLPHPAAGGPGRQQQQAVQLHARQRQRAHRGPVVQRRHPPRPRRGGEQGGDPAAATPRIGGRAGGPPVPPDAAAHRSRPSRHLPRLPPRSRA